MTKYWKLKHFHAENALRKHAHVRNKQIYPKMLKLKNFSERILTFICLVFTQTIDGGHTLELPRSTPIYVLSKNKNQNIKNFLLKIFNFYNLQQKYVYYMGVLS